jgi:hypothetical protein
MTCVVIDIAMAGPAGLWATRGDARFSHGVRDRERVGGNEGGTLSHSAALNRCAAFARFTHVAIEQVFVDVRKAHVSSSMHPGQMMLSGVALEGLRSSIRAVRSILTIARFLGLHRRPGPQSDDNYWKNTAPGGQQN